MNSKPAIMLAAVGCAVGTGYALAQQNDITFFVIGKHANYSQNDAGDSHAVDFSFFSELFLTSGGDADNATLTFPTGEHVNFHDMRDALGPDRDNILLYSGPDRFTKFAELQRRYPDGDYQVSFDTPSGSIVAGVLHFENRALPNPPKIQLNQGDQVNCARFSPSVDIDVTWGSFDQGKSDQNGILDDLVFVILTDVSGARVAHSGRPFEQRPYLTYADSSFTIAASALKAEQDYTLSVEHAILDDTTRFDGVPAFTTRAVTTRLSISTGPADMTSCVAAE